MSAPTEQSTALDGVAATLQPVLLVDDDPTAAATTEAILTRAGYAVASESRGDAVLKLVRTMFMRLVVTELYVPCSEGRCVATVLRGERRTRPRLRIIVFTRHRSPDDQAWALAAGCDAIIAKTAPPEVLVHEVRRLDDYSAPAISLLSR